MKKRIFYIVFVALIVVGCALFLYWQFGRELSKLEAQAELVNAECPVDLGAVGSLSCVSYRHGDLVLEFEVSEEEVNVDSLRANIEMVKQNAVEFLNHSTGTVAEMFKLLKEENAGLTIRYKGMKTGNELQIGLSPEEVKSISRRPAKPQAVEESLSTRINLTNAQLPVEIKAGMFLTQIRLEDKNVVYTVSVDEGQYSIDLLKGNCKDMKGILIAAMRVNDPAMKNFLTACKDSGRGIVYEYVGEKSKKNFQIEIAHKELQTIIASIDTCMVDNAVPDTLPE